MIEFVGFVYWHNGEHEAMVVDHIWKPGEYMLSASVKWPEAKPGDKIVCGTCGHEFTQWPAQNQLRAPFLSPVRPRVQP